MFLIISIVMTCFLSNVHGLNDTSLETLQFKVLQALTNSVLYMEEHYKLLNLDALTGLRIVQELRKLADLTLWRIIIQREIKKEEKRKFNEQIAGLINSEENDASYARENKSLESFSEDNSDECLEEVIDGRCDISDDCIEMMTLDHVHGYSATHQIYYFLITSESKCLSETSKSAIRNLLSQLCARTFVEAARESKNSDIQQDLFMEQVGLCGLSGYYREFSRSEWVQSILDWQRPSGCYGRAQSFLSELNRLDENHRFRRESSHKVKREERIMTDDCLCHRTTVAVIALSQNFRALAEQVQHRMTYN
ncbi:C16orf89 [Bugula neritina]|uniref:C16orf89 n=1 Tax=Bugula neritina TaxID=10212 RepID=A0A7J7JGP5_BUGNE|nr:C16orf89 [Bugula neritina]